MMIFNNKMYLFIIWTQLESLLHHEFLSTFSGNWHTLYVFPIEVKLNWFLPFVVLNNFVVSEDSIYSMLCGYYSIFLFYVSVMFLLYLCVFFHCSHENKYQIQLNKLKPWSFLRWAFIAEYSFNDCSFW